jgi:hypothetical protein
MNNRPRGRTMRTQTRLKWALKTEGRGQDSAGSR